MQVVEDCLSQMEMIGLFTYLSWILLPSISHSQHCQKILCCCDKIKMKEQEPPYCLIKSVAIAARWGIQTLSTPSKLQYTQLWIWKSSKGKAGVVKLRNSARVCLRREYHCLLELDTQAVMHKNIHAPFPGGEFPFLLYHCPLFGTE